MTLSLNTWNLTLQMNLFSNSTNTPRRCQQSHNRELNQYIMLRLDKVAASRKRWYPNHLLPLISAYMQINFPALLGACIRYIYDFLAGDKTSVIERSNWAHNLHKLSDFNPTLTKSFRFFAPLFLQTKCTVGRKRGPCARTGGRLTTGHSYQVSRRWEIYWPDRSL